jgi:hypothetical protein
MEPTLIQMAEGGWLAITNGDADVPVGVFGDTADDARRKLADAVAERDALRLAATAR